MVEILSLLVTQRDQPNLSQPTWSTQPLNTIPEQVLPQPSDSSLSLPSGCTSHSGPSCFPTRLSYAQVSPSQSQAPSSGQSRSYAPLSGSTLVLNSGQILASPSSSTLAQLSDQTLASPSNQPPSTPTLALPSSQSFVPLSNQSLTPHPSLSCQSPPPVQVVQNKQPLPNLSPSQWYLSNDLDFDDDSDYQSVNHSDPDNRHAQWFGPISQNSSYSSSSELVSSEASRCLTCSTKDSTTTLQDTSKT